MTSVVIFRLIDGGVDAIVSMADTRFVTQNNQGKTVRTSLESGSKLFSIPLKVAQGYGFVHGKPVDYIIDSSFGFAFAGNTTIGLNLAGALSQICGFLECHHSTCSISLEALAEFSSKLLTDWHRKYNQWGPWNHVCEVAIFGECPSDRNLHAYHLKPTNSYTGYYIEHSEFSFSDPVNHVINGTLHDETCHPWLILGDRRPDIERLCKARVDDVTAAGELTQKGTLKAQCAPQYVLEAIVSEDCFKTIGNGVQTLFVDSRGARPQRWIRPQSHDIPADQYEWFSYLNYDLSELGKIGEAEIGDTGGLPMAYVPTSSGSPQCSEFTAELDRILNRHRLAIIGHDSSHNEPNI